MSARHIAATLDLLTYVVTPGSRLWLLNADRRLFIPNHVKYVTPNQRINSRRDGLLWIKVPNPPVPRKMRAASEAAQIATIRRMCCLISPWRITKAFCAPIAIIRDKPVRKPGIRVSTRAY